MNLSLINNYFDPKTVLDIGANVGQFHSNAKSIWPESYIFSIEASDACEPYLNEITNDYLICLLTKDDTKYEFFSRKNDPTCTGNSIYRELTEFYSDDQLDVIKKDGIKLDDLFTKDSMFDLIKIDTQGSELDILEGGKELCKKAKGILLEVSFNEYNLNAPLVDQVLKYMDNFKFKPAIVLDIQTNHGSHQEDILFLNER
jgi:FkbM family methyltransferase|tara:strand:+ start:7235 stop:7837 length:603 start_codon:yes stop_codon:yes gene_type:complete